DSCGENTNPYANLSGLLLPAWGYAYAKTGNTTYLDQGTQILTGLVQIGGGDIFGEKQVAQMFRSSPSYLGYIPPESTRRPPSAHAPPAVGARELRAKVA